MSASDLHERAPSQPARQDLLSRILGHPLAYLASAVLLLAVFAWPFVTEPERVAPTKDPAFYTWRTEAFITEEPTDLLAIEGPRGMFAAGYRVAAPIIGGLLRQVADVHSLSVTTMLMVALPVLISLLLAGFAYRELPDPLLWHAVAFTSAGLLLTPPFVGYLDNVLSLFFLAAALHFLRPSRESWAARIMLFLFLLLSGLTHPTTLVIFCATLGLMAGVRLLVRKFDLRSTLRDDGWMLAMGFASAVVTYLIWTVGIWGRSVSLNEAALPPPYGSAFFIDRMLIWVDEMRPVLNGPLLAIGIVAVLVGGWRALDREVTRVSILWLAPLVGLFGFIAGIAYPYYRFFNTTLAWLLLAGIGAGVAARFFVDRSRAGGLARLSLLGVVAVGAVIVTNLSVGLGATGWLGTEARRDLDALRATLAPEDRDRPVIFVIDARFERPFQIYGYSKLSGNTSRYGLPPGQIDKAYMYLGSIGNLLSAGRPTKIGDETYDELSRDLAEDLLASKGDPIIVVAEIFNPTGANARIFDASGEPDLLSILPGGVFSDTGYPQEEKIGWATIWTLSDGAIYQWGESGPVGLERSGLPPEDPGPLHVVWVVVGIGLLFLSGLIALRWLPVGRSWAEALGLVPAIGLAIATTVGVVVVAVQREPFGEGTAWTTAALAIAISLLPLARRRPQRA